MELYDDLFERFPDGTIDRQSGYHRVVKIDACDLWGGAVVYFSGHGAYRVYEACLGDDYDGDYRINIESFVEFVSPNTSFNIDLTETFHNERNW